MEAGDVEEKLMPDREDVYSDTQLSEDFFARLRFSADSQLICDDDVKVPQGNGTSDDSGSNTEDDEDEEEDDENEDDFSFVCGGELISPVAAGDAFADGQIKPVFPLFKKELLLLSGGDSASSSASLEENMSIKKVFVETEHEAAAGNDEIAGPYCEWSDRKAMDLSQQQACKKSNSTGFSKFWRLKEFRARCNSDGRDAFVFLNHGHRAPAAAKKPAEEGSKRKVKKDGKGKKTPLSAHEVYLRNKQKDGERRRRSPTYLPYRPELVGFFTTLNGGLTKNVHPY